MFLRYLRREIKKNVPKWIFETRLNKSKTKRLLLTFDDGPDELLTPKILDILDRYHARVVFFILGGQALKNRDLINRISAHGHIVANHTFSHRYDLSKNYKGYRQEVGQTQDVIEEIIGKRATLFRPPCGIFTFIVFVVARQFNLRVILWSNEGGEWSFNKMSSAEEIATKLKFSFEDRQIVLLHDNNEKMLDVLELTLPYLQKEGFDLSSAVEDLSDGT